jgi:hemolysin activation/secretion protein
MAARGPLRLVATVVVGLLASPPLAAQDAPAAPDPTGPSADAQSFDVWEFVVRGNTTLPVLAIEEAVYPFLGPGRTVADVEGARAALEQRYGDAGFITVAVNVPEQTVEGGVVTLEVLEGRVGRLRVQGSRYYDLGRIKAAAPSLAEGTVPNVAGVQADTADLNRLPGRRVQPLLKAGVEPGTVDADLVVEDEPPWSAFVELNNQESVNTEPLRLRAGVAYANLFQLGHEIALNYTVAPQDRSQSEAVDASYTFRVPEWSPSLRLFVVRSDSEVAAVAGTQVIGEGTLYGGSAIFPLPALGPVQQTAIAGLTRKRFEQDVLLGEDESRAPLAYTTASLDYSLTLAHWQGVTSAGAGLVHALPTLSDGERRFRARRQGARDNFYHASFQLGREQYLPLGFGLDARLSGQLADQPLVNNEQLIAGGVSSVRGYLEAEQLGDRGVLGGVELTSPDLAARLGAGFAAVVPDLRLRAFLEGAYLRLDDTLPGEDASTKLASTGIGTSFRLGAHLRGAVDLAVPLHGTSETDAGDARVLFSLSAGLR